MGVLTKMFGTYSEHQLKKLRKTIDKIEALEEHYRAMPDAELRGMTAVFKQQLPTRISQPS